MKKIVTTLIVAGVILVGSAGSALALDPAAQQLNLLCKSTIFDCSKPLAYVSFPDGKRCSISSISLNKQDQLLMIEGDKVTTFLNPGTQNAVACVNSNKGICPESSGFMTVGQNADGSTHLLILTGGDDLVIPNPAPLFAPIMALAKPLVEVASSPVTQTCDVLLADVKTAISNAGYVPPSMEFVDLGGGIQVPVDVGVFSMEGIRAVMLYQYAYGKQNPVPNPMPANNGQLVPGIAVVTIGDTAETFTRVFKPFPVSITGYIQGLDLVVASSSDQEINVTMSLINLDESVGIFSCAIPLDATTPMSCVLRISVAKGDPSLSKIMLTVKLLKIMRSMGVSGEFGNGLADILITNPLSGSTEIVVHNFEGFGDVANAIIYDQTGGHVYRMNPDKSVTEVVTELLPSASKCNLVDLDTYAGKDLVCFVGDSTHEVIYFIPKRNLAPKIDNMTLAATADSYQLGAVLKTQEGEALSYSWGIYRMKGNLLTKIDGALNKPTEASPTFDLSALGAKDAADLAEGGYFAVLTVTDTGGLSDSVMGPIPTKSLVPVAPVEPVVPVVPVVPVEPVLPVTPVVPVTPVAPVVPIAPVAPIVIPTTPIVIPLDSTTIPTVDVKAAIIPLTPPSESVGAGMFRMEGGFGCSTLPTAPSSNFIWVLVIPAFMSRILRASYRRR